MYSIHAYWCNEISLRMYVGKPQSNPWNIQCTQIFTLAPNRYVFYNGSVSLVEERPRYLVNLLHSFAFVPILYYYQTIHVTRYSISFMYSLSDHNLRICLNVKVRVFLLYLRFVFLNCYEPRSPWKNVSTVKRFYFKFIVWVCPHCLLVSAICVCHKYERNTHADSCYV